MCGNNKSREIEERRKYLLLHHITFVTNQNFIYGFSCMLFDVSDPVSNVFRDQM